MLPALGEHCFRGFPEETHHIRHLQILIDDFNWTLSTWPIETDENTHFVIDKTAEQTVFLAESLPLFRDLIRGGIDAEISQVLGSPAGRWGCRLLQLVFRGLELAWFFVDRGPVPKEGSDCEDEKAELRSIRGELSEMAANVEYILDVKVGQVRSKRTSQMSLDEEHSKTLEAINSNFIRLAANDLTETACDAAQQIEAITGIEYPPKSLDDWGRLLRLAGFDQRDIRQVFAEFGIPSFEGGEELPRGYVSAKASASQDKQPRQDGRVIPGESYLLTQAILAGLEPHRPPTLRARGEAGVGKQESSGNIVSTKDVQEKPESNADDAIKPAKKPKLEWMAHAMLLVREHPDWSDAKIAREIGKAPSTLSRCDEYKAAAALARRSGKAPRKGFKTKNDAGQTDIEAYTDDPAEMD